MTASATKRTGLGRNRQFRSRLLIRDAQGAIEQGDKGIGLSREALLKRARAIGRRPENLADSTLKAYEGDLDRSWTAGWA